MEKNKLLSGLRRKKKAAQQDASQAPQGPVIRVEPFTGTDYRMLSTLLNSFRSEVGQQPPTTEEWHRLRDAIEEDYIRYFIAYLDDAPVGLCSLCPYYSSIRSCPSAVFEDFYVRPEARSQGIARVLVKYAADTVRSWGGRAMSVTCPPDDEAMYHALGFSDDLGFSKSMAL